MEWEKASVELGAELDRLLTGFIAHKKTMFGCPAYFVNNNMFTGVKASMVFLRLSESDRTAVMEESDEITIFEPRPAFFMKEYVQIPESRLADHDFINRWLERSFAYVSSLPPKVPGRKKR
jgi:TfoX/Sxy family transcriptional regulator of competence genes